MKPTNKPSNLSREEALERRLADLERMVRRMPATLGGQGATATTIMVQQSAHGFVAKDVLRHNGTSWTKAQADTAANAVVGGMVVAVPSPDVFILATGGYVAGLSGLTAGSVHYLSAATAGLLTTTAPSIAVSVLLADSTTSGTLMSLGGSSLPSPSANQVLASNGSNVVAFSRTITLGDTSNAGSITIGNATSASAIVISPTLVTAAGRVMSVREIDVCDAGVAKKMLVLASAPY